MSKIQEVIELSEQLNRDTEALLNKVAEISVTSGFGGGVDPFVFGLTTFILACFVGYFVVWRVTPALHTPLMAVTNAISGVIVVGAIIALGSTKAFSMISVISFLAITIASINIFGGFFVTWRMLEMFKK
jgi:NAD(P) transhydrogenase subunit alpha